MADSGPHRSRAIAVYCGSSPGRHVAYRNAAASLGFALAKAQRPLVYGGGTKGIMGIVSKSCLDAGGQVTGVMPYAMVAAGGEKEKTDLSEQSLSKSVDYDDGNGKSMEQIVVNSMHERKSEMARRVGGFVGLPGGYGTFEEICEVTTWTQLGIHRHPVVVLNVLGFYNPLRELIANAVRDGFIRPANERLVIFVDGPSDPTSHESFDWGTAAINALEGWSGDEADKLDYDWTLKMTDGKPTHGDVLDAV